MFKHTSNSFDSRKMPQLTFNNILRYALKEIQNLWDELIVRLDIRSGSEVICWTRLLARSRVLAETLLPSLETTSLALLTKTTLFFYIRSVKIQRFKRERERERGRHYLLYPLLYIYADNILQLESCISNFSSTVSTCSIMYH